MGNCFCCTASAPRKPLVRGRFLEDSALGHQAPAGLAVEAAVASWAANSPIEDAQCVHFDGNIVFLAVFDGIGGPEAAQLCRANAWTVYQECLVACGGDTQGALRATFRRLDTIFFETTESLPVKAYVGASATIALLDLEIKSIVIASHGGCLAVQGSSHGAFSRQCVNGIVLPGCSSHRNEDEERRLKEAFPSLANSLFETVKGRRLLLGLSPVTRAIGLGALKTNDIAVWHNSQKATAQRFPIKPPPSETCPYVTCEPHIGVHGLELGGHALVLGTTGFWRLVSPTACATWCKTNSSPGAPPVSQPEPKGDILQEDGSSGDDSTPLKPPSLAAGLVLLGLSTAASRLRGRQSNLPASVDDMEAVPCGTHTEVVGGAVAEGLRSARKGGRSKRGKPAPPCRLDYHEDLTCVTLSVSLPSTSAWVSHEDRPVGGAPASPLKPCGTQHRRQSLRWSRVRGLEGFHIAKRRSLIRSWLSVVDMARTTTRRERHERARQAEVDAWRNEGRAIKVTESGSYKAVDVHV